ncbi:pitrilysin family protein [Terasakiella sp. SH-1]|uniref:M16 family metallopeptidase n=1 Tax=Terasakiella sp. SH-1 TaxID=2560057 RepID=UPI001F0DDD10|nr:pitrilysin family protein [Terasakiella sp. SH-1]
MRYLLVILGLLLAFPVSAGVFNPKTFTLDNGMEVVLIENNRVPVVRHMVWYKVGSADEPAGKSGIAHYFEHLMFKATKKLAAGEFSKIVAKNGGQDNAFTSYDYTAYYQTVAKDRLGLVMEMEADRMTNLSLTKEVIEPERQVILEERRQRTDNNPGAQLREQIDTVQYMNHPYRIPVIGWAHEIKALSLEDLNRFYKAWYAPNNAILIVEGDVSMAELKPLAEKHYGSIPRGPEMIRLRPTEPPAHADRRVIKRDQRVRQPSLQRTYLAPSYRTSTEDDKAPYALEILENIMGGAATSRLYTSLVIDQKLAVSAGMSYSPSRLDMSELTFWASPQAGVSMAVLEEALLKEISVLLEKGVSFDEVARAQKSLVNDAVFARDNLGTAAQVIGGAMAIGLSVDQIESWPDAIQAITVEDVNRALRTVLKDQKTVTGLLLGLEDK